MLILIAKAIGKLALIPENLIDFILKYLPNLLQTITDLKITIFKKDRSDGISLIELISISEKKWLH